jgi:hypothetical protein
MNAAPGRRRSEVLTEPMEPRSWHRMMMAADRLSRTMTAPLVGEGA